MDRNLALEFVRVTEAAAIEAARWTGRGDKKKADGAAVNAMRARFNQIYFPGWDYWLDDQPLGVDFKSNRPLPQFSVPSGDHTFSARFAHTPIRRLADIISLVALIGAVIYGLTPTFSGFSHLQRSR